MNRFVQLHLLTSYPPANLNRDDLGRPKTAIMGSAQRLRISSQSLKRAWRESDIFSSALESYKGVRTKRIGLEWIHKMLVESEIPDETATMWSRDIQQVFGEPDSSDKNDDEERKDLLNKQLAFIAPVEKKAVDEFVQSIIAFHKAQLSDEFVQEIAKLQEEREKKSKKEDKKKISDKIVNKLRTHLLRKTHAAADIAMFGRMLASSPAYNTEAAAQVAHAISVHSVAVEDDFFTAIDDLNRGEEDMGAGHMGEAEFAAGLFYLYVCIDRVLLLDNLNGDSELMRKTLSALIEAVAKVAPTGKQNSFASRARASYIFCEKGDEQPRSLSVAFLKPVNDNDMLTAAIKRLRQTRDDMDSVYGPCASEHREMNATSREGSLQMIIDCAATE